MPPRSLTSWGLKARRARLRPTIPSRGGPAPVCGALNGLIQPEYLMPLVAGIRGVRSNSSQMAPLKYRSWTFGFTGSSLILFLLDLVPETQDPGTAQGHLATCRESRLRGSCPRGMWLFHRPLLWTGEPSQDPWATQVWSPCTAEHPGRHRPLCSGQELRLSLGAPHREPTMR